MMIMFVMMYYVVCLFLPTVVSGLPMPLTVNNIRAPLFVDIDVRQMNGEIKKYIDDAIDTSVQDTCYQEIDKVVTNRHTDLSKDFEGKFLNLKQNLNDEVKNQLNGKSALLSNTLSSLENDLRSKVEQLERLHTRISNELAEEKKKYHNVFSSLENAFKSKFNHLESHSKNKLDSFKTHMETTFKNHKDHLNKEVVDMKTRLTSSEKQVAVTSCANHGSYISSVPIPFPSVRTSYGIINLSTLKTNGLFTCESDGLYIVSVTIVSKQYNGEFHIYKNNNNLVRIFIQNKESDKYYSGSMTIVVLMSVKETISVKPWYDNSYVSGIYKSCITVVKVK